MIIACFSFEQFNKPGCINPDVQRQTVEGLLTTPVPSVELCMQPEFIRLAPPLYTADDEVFSLYLFVFIQMETKQTILRMLACVHSCICPDGRTMVHGQVSSE